MEQYPWRERAARDAFANLRGRFARRFCAGEDEVAATASDASTAGRIEKRNAGKRGAEKRGIGGL